MISDVPNGFEAHKLINISLGKIAASRSGRTGASLHKSLLVASVLHKARYVYLEEAHHYNHAIFCPPQGPPEEYIPEPPRAPTPLPEVTVTPVLTTLECVNNNTSEDDESYDSDDECKSRLSDDGSGDKCEDDDKSSYTNYQSRKRRRISEQEIEAAVSSILPKRLRSEGVGLVSDPKNSCSVNSEANFKYETEILCTSCGYEPSACHCSDQSSSSEDEEICNMEVDHITSLVSIFSFNQQQQSDLCSTQAHQADSVGLPVLALTA